MKALITGSAGFVGGHLCRTLKEQGWEVAATDQWLGASPVCDWYSAINLTDGVGINYYIKQHKPDVVFHLGAVVGPEKVVKDVAHTIAVNVVGTQNVVKSAKDAGVKRVVFTSTSEVYAGLGTTPFPYNEEHSVPQFPANTYPRSAYPISKLAAEHIVRASGIGVVARIFNTSGPGQSVEYAIPRMVRDALEGRAIEVTGDGLQTRCFCHVADTVQGLITLAESEGDGIVGGVFNVGRDTEISMLELAEVVRELVAPVDLTFVPMREGELRTRRVPNTQKIQVLGWKATRQLRDIILAVAEYQHGILDGSPVDSAHTAAR